MKYNLYGIACSDELYHHGIKGQEWGVRNGPPYPLDDGNHSAKEKKSKWKTSLNSLKLSLTDEQKKYVLLGAAAIGTMYLDYKTEIIGTTLNATSSFIEGDIESASGKIFYNLVKVAEGDANPDISRNLQSQINGRSKTGSLDPKTGLYIKNSPSSIEDDCKKVNPDFSFYNPDTSENCGLCSVAYDMRRRGYDVTAGFSHTGTLPQDFREMYKGVRTRHLYGDRVVANNRMAGGMTADAAKRVIKRLNTGKNTRGLLSVGWSYSRGGHAMAYEVLGNGELLIICPQTNKVYKGNDAVRLLQNVSSVESIRTDNLKPNIDYMKKKHIIM